VQPSIKNSAKLKIIDSIKSLSLVGQITIFLSLLTLIISLTQPAFYIDWEEDPAAWADSWLLFFFGWTFPLGGALIPFLIWTANPIYIMSIIQTIKGKITGFYLSIIATLIAFSFSQFDTIMASESGRESPIKSLELGYKFWLASFVIMSIGTGVNFYLTSKQTNNLTPNT
jgi:hypothetical protein